MFSFLLLLYVSPLLFYFFFFTFHFFRVLFFLLFLRVLTSCFILFHSSMTGMVGGFTMTPDHQTPPPPSSCLQQHRDTYSCSNMTPRGYEPLTLGYGGGTHHPRHSPVSPPPPHTHHPHSAYHQMNGQYNSNGANSTGRCYAEVFLLQVVLTFALLIGGPTYWCDFLRYLPNYTHIQRTRLSATRYNYYKHRVERSWLCSILNLVFLLWEMGK